MPRIIIRNTNPTNSLFVRLVCVTCSLFVNPARSPLTTGSTLRSCNIRCWSCLPASRNLLHTAILQQIEGVKPVRLPLTAVSTLRSCNRRCQFCLPTSHNSLHIARHTAILQHKVWILWEKIERASWAFLTSFRPGCKIVSQILRHKNARVTSLVVRSR